jgi:hypothetical protein
MKITKIEVLDSWNRDDSAPWVPTEGNEFIGYIGPKSPEIADRLRKDCARILAGGGDPHGPNNKVGLVIGKVQSGKTSSFTGVAALAADSGYRVIVVIAGTTQLLVNQTAARLRKDLRLDGPASWERWKLFHVSDDGSGGESGAALDHLRDYLPVLGQHENGAPAIVVVMKNKAHLQRLTSVFVDFRKSTGEKFVKFPALIVDDEAHMFSPNVGKNGEASAIYSQMRSLIQVFHSRLMLQYTATPQANLLMEIVDELSPHFVRLLEPGNGYFGGAELFLSDDEMIHEIPDEQILKNPKIDDKTPRSLIESLANYLVTIAARSINGASSENLSMLVHSDVKTKIHDVYRSWINDYIAFIKNISRNDLEDGDFPSEIVTAHVNLGKTVGNLPSLEACVYKIIEILKTVTLRIETVNNKNQIGRVDFNDHPYHVINGGTMLGVGYTVEGLVTTHMVRSSGTGLADSIQQRGRFFGYLGERAKYVRIWLTKDLKQCFYEYAKHEQHLRTSLVPYDDSMGAYGHVPSLKEWKRSFWLNSSMQLTRKAARRIELEGFKFAQSGWTIQSYPSPKPAFQDAKDAVIALRNATHDFGGLASSSIWGGGQDAESTCHLVGRIKVSDLLGALAVFPFSADDVKRFTAIRIAVETFSERFSACEFRLVIMGRGQKRDLWRKRTIKDGYLDLFQGRSDGRGGYQGDARVNFPDSVTVQVHPIEILPASEDFQNKSYAIAVHFSPNLQRIANSILVEV